MREETSSMDPWSIFLYWMKAPMTREKYRGRLANTASIRTTALSYFNNHH